MTSMCSPPPPFIQDPTAQQLLLRTLVHILTQASNDGSCTVASLRDKNLGSSPLEPVDASRGGGGGEMKDDRERQSGVEPMDSYPQGARSLARGGQGSPGVSSSGHKRKHIVLLEEEMEEEEEENRRVGRKGLKPGANEDGSNLPLRQAMSELLPQSTMDSLRRRAGDTPHHSSPGTGRKITADQLSIALGNIVGQERGELPPKHGNREDAPFGSPATPSTVKDSTAPMKEPVLNEGRILEHRQAPHSHSSQPPNSSQRRVGDLSVQLHLGIR